MNTPIEAVWFNGAAGRERLAFSRGLHYGDGVFRTLLKFDCRLIDIEAQIEKLSTDAAALGLRAPSPGALRDDVETAADGIPDCVIKILLTRAGEGRGYRTEAGGVDRLVLRYPRPEFDRRCWTTGISAIRSPVTMAAQPLLAGIKHLNRLEQVLASRGWPEGVDEAVLCDESGAPVCGTRSNLFWLARGVLHTPSLERCGVAGVMRAKVLTCASSIGLEISIGAQPWAMLATAEEAFVCNSLIGIWPLHRLDGRTWGAPGAATADLMQRLVHPTLHAR